MHFEPTSTFTENRILAALSPDDFGLLQPHLEPIDLGLRRVLEPANNAIKHNYFIERGLASVIAIGKNGDRLEVGIIFMLAGHGKTGEGTLARALAKEKPDFAVGSAGLLASIRRVGDILSLESGRALREAPMRRLEAPWSAEKTEGGYRVRDARGRTLCYIYCRDDEKNAEIANVLTWDEGRRVAANIAKLPDLLGAGS